MNKQKTLFLVGVVVILSLVAFLFLNSDRRGDDNKTNPTPTPFEDGDGDISDLIKVDTPFNDQLVKSPLGVSGQARGYWFFEASFPVRVFDANGIELGVTPAQAQSEWMTEDFVGFNAILVFKKPTTETGVLVLQKDNPTGLPEHDNEIRIPIRFDLANWPDDTTAKEECFIAGCSGQLCVEEVQKDLVTTCEYREEYVCYKNAKCARQEDGKCGWTPTESLVACLTAAFQKESQ